MYKHIIQITILSALLFVNPSIAENKSCEQCTNAYNECKKSGKAEDDCVQDRSDCIQRNEEKGCDSTMGGNACEQCTLLYENCKEQGTNEDECIKSRSDCISNNKEKGCSA